MTKVCRKKQILGNEVIRVLTKIAKNHSESEKSNKQKVPHSHFACKPTSEIFETGVSRCV